MKVKATKHNVDKLPENEVISASIKRKHYRETSEEFDPDGIFSEEIFGYKNKAFTSCKCGELKKPGFCEKCKTRVLDRRHMPDFYIDTPCRLLWYFADLSSLDFKESDNNTRFNAYLAEDICRYKAFYYNGEFYGYFINDNSIYHYDDFFKINNELAKNKYVSFDRLKEDYEKIDDKILDLSKVEIGLDALKHIANNAEEFWENNTNDYVSVPHTSFRPGIRNKNYERIMYEGTINIKYVEFIEKVIQIKELIKYNNDPLDLLICFNSLDSFNNKFVMELLKKVQGNPNTNTNNKSTFIRTECQGHFISNAIRATLVNRNDIDEDVLIIGDTLIETLYPYLYKKYNGKMSEINRHFIENDEMVFVNRNPTISYYSEMCFKPRIASCYPYGHTEGTNNCLLHNYKYCEENKENMGVFEDNIGDIERFSNLDKDGIDTIGLRTIGMNPIVCDGFGADYDGDVLFVASIFSNNAKEEARKMLPSRKYVEYSNRTIRNHIIDDFLFSPPKNLDMDKINNLHRKDYMVENEKLGKTLWEREKIPTIADICDLIDDKDNERINDVVNFFDNKDQLIKMAENTIHLYSQQESTDYIEDVIASNQTDISEAGYFYKESMSALDDLRIINDKCGSKGVEYKVDEITEEIYNYRIKSMCCKEDGNKFEKKTYEKFMETCKENGWEKIHIRTPLTCEHMKDHKICKKCAGELPGNSILGAFTTLIVTEHATQSALSSMNNGKKENINDILKRPYNDKAKWENIIDWVNKTVEDLKNPQVQSRFYELFLIARIRNDDRGNPSVCTVKKTIDKNTNYLSQYFFHCSESSLRKVLNAKEFEDDGLRLKIAMNDFN